MFCRKCGNQNPDNSRVCGYCGTSFVPPATVVPSGKPVKKKTSKPKKTEKFVVAAVFVAVLALVAAVVIGVVISGGYFSSDTKDDEKTETAEVKNVTDGETEQENEKDEVSQDEDSDGKENSKKTKPKNKKENSDKNDSSKEDDGESSESKDDSDKKPEQDEASQQKEVPDVQESDESDGDFAVKDEFLAEASDIEDYSAKYYESATSSAQLNTESAVVFEKWDVLLNEVYDYLEATLPADEFSALADDELEWIIEKENAIAAVGEEYYGSSQEANMRNSVAIEYTIERCYYLISLIN